MTGSLTEKCGKYYAIINYYTEDCKRKQKWINTGYEVKGNKKKAEQFLRNTLAEYERNKVDIDKDMLFTDFLDQWLLIIKNNVRANTLSSYRYVVDKHIKPYFAGKRLTLSQLKPMHLQKYYAYKMDTGLSANSVLKHHTNIHNALEHALRMNMIPFNQADRVYLPKRKKFVSKFYDENQLNELLSLVKGTPIETAVYLTAYYGLRRSEVLGLKWDAIDFQK